MFGFCKKTPPEPLERKKGPERQELSEKQERQKEDNPLAEVYTMDGTLLGRGYHNFYTGWMYPKAIVLDNAESLFEKMKAEGNKRYARYVLDFEKGVIVKYIDSGVKEELEKGDKEDGTD